MKAYSQDMRDRVLRALSRGDRPSDIARRFEVSRIWVYQVRHRWEKDGNPNSLPVGGYRPSRLAPWESLLRCWLEAKVDLTLAEVGVQIKVPALWHQLNKWGLSFKKTLHTSEQERDDVQQARREWKQQQPALDAMRLVFLDETGVNTKMTRTHGRALLGERCVASTPHAHWKTTTFIAALRHNALTAPMVVDGPMDGALFLAYVRTFLCPTLKPGDIVIADNLSSHKVAGVKEAIEAVGATLRYLPAYSPNLNPIEKCFAKLKALLRKAAARTVKTLWTQIGAFLDCFSPTECNNYFISSGYVYI